MTHEYNIGLGGRIETAAGGPGGDTATATAIAWAADRVLAVGPDDVVRAISRGDSTFFDLAGSIVTALPADPSGAEAAVAEAVSGGVDGGLSALLIEAGLLSPDISLEPGSLADLALWQSLTTAASREVARAPRLLATVRAGVFSRGHPRRGPFAQLSG